MTHAAITERGAVAVDLRVAARHMADARWSEAEAIYQRLAHRFPAMPEAWGGLGLVRYSAGRVAEAEPVLRRAVALQPKTAAYRENLAVTLRALKRIPEALEEYEQAISLAPDRPSLLSNFGNALSDAGQLERAAEFLRRAVALAPENALFRTNLVRTLIKMKRADEALAHIEHVRKLASDPEVEVDYGHVLMFLKRHEDAIEAYRRAQKAGIVNHNMFHNLGTALQYMGRMDEAAEAYRAAVAAQPDFVVSLRQLTGTRKHDAPGIDVAELENLLRRANFTVAGRAELHMGLAKIYDDLGDYARAFHHLQSGNQYIRATIEYDSQKNSNYIDILINVFDEPFFSRRRDFGLNSDVPIFVLGMPRSGTTLVEQIMCSHPDVHGAGELMMLYELSADMGRRLNSELKMPFVARIMDAAAAREIAGDYLAYLRGFNSHTRFIIDKMPLNFRMLGLIAVLFPNSRVIHCVRDARDTSLSCYFARFHDQLNFAFNLVEIGRYYRDYERLMTHWRRIIPNPMLEVQYEKLVVDQKGETQRMLEFCDLTWSDRCLTFHQTEREVLTASNWQVRQPIYSSSVGRWRNYRDFLGPLIAELSSDGHQNVGSSTSAPSLGPSSTRFAQR
jgi:tetratricopeptide (TPR) repeat protein